MTPMIDVVFQMIIFFVCTAQLDAETFSRSILLPAAPNAPAEEGARDPRTITIELDESGRIFIGRTRLTSSKLKKVLAKTVADFGDAARTIPVVIRADASAYHRQVRRVMDVCTDAGLRRIAFVAVKDEG